MDLEIQPRLNLRLDTGSSVGAENRTGLHFAGEQFVRVYSDRETRFIVVRVLRHIRI